MLWWYIAIALFLEILKAPWADRVGKNKKGFEVQLQHLEAPQNMSIEVLKCSQK